jgi:hypothetical protein
VGGTLGNSRWLRLGYDSGYLGLKCKMGRRCVVCSAAKTKTLRPCLVRSTVVDRKRRAGGEAKTKTKTKPTHVFLVVMRMAMRSGAGARTHEPRAWIFGLDMAYKRKERSKRGSIIFDTKTHRKTKSKMVKNGQKKGARKKIHPQRPRRLRSNTAR